MNSLSETESPVSGRALLSMSEFLYICEYLGVTPMEFFNEEKSAFGTSAPPGAVKKVL